ncbi:MAG TPA: hypothetical protein VNF68_11550 [Candidatus Baltobacteraceae bacterium]|nr:hypothetical protein [Candidatus Baltobacteraceae bacterium]
MCDISARLKAETGLEYRIYGFDSGTGMPPARDYRDHPDLYALGDFPMDHPLLASALPANAKLIIGDVAETVPAFIETLSEEFPIGFVSVDVDYYWSSKEALRLFSGHKPEVYLPTSVVYFDDIAEDEHNSWAGELLSIEEFNGEHPYRKLERNRFIRNKRVMKHAWWLDQVYYLHTLDHPHRSSVRDRRGAAPREVANPFIGQKL